MVALHGKQPYHVHPSLPEWRNWYTHQTQNLASVKDMSVRVRPPAPSALISSNIERPSSPDQTAV